MDSGQQIISPTNQGPLLTTIAWAFLVLMLLASITKVWNRWQRTRQLMLDDLWQTVAAAIAVAQTILVNAKVSAGFGRSLSDLTRHQLTSIEKLSYSAQILYAAVLCLTKVATSTVIIELAPVTFVIVSMRVFIACLGAWFLCAILVIAFQSGLPHPWEHISGHGANMDIFWGFFGTIDILSDLWLVCIPAGILGSLQTGRAKKFEVISVFGFRVLNIPLTILRLMYIVRAYGSRDVLATMLNADIVTEVHMHMGIVFASAPFIKTVFESMQHGMIAGDVTYASKDGNGLPSHSMSLQRIANPFTHSTAYSMSPNEAKLPQQINRSVHPYRELDVVMIGDTTVGEQAIRPRQTSDTIQVTTTISTHLE